MDDIEVVTRRTFLSRTWRLSLGLLGIASVAGIVNERLWYQVTEVPLALSKLPDAFNGWKIVQISDIHFGFFYGLEEFRKVVEIINSIQPDLIFFTGDLVDVNRPFHENAIALLQSLKTGRGGKWAVLGNHDFFPKDGIIKILQDSGFLVLDNSRGHIAVDDQRLYVAGLDDALNGAPNIEQALVGVADDDCVLLLAHEPDTAEINSKYPVSAQFSGHSHGGQVRIPLYGPILEHRFAEKYVEGLYYVGEQKMPLYVNRGIGTTNLPIRIFCRPEITVFHLSRLL